MKLVSMVFEDIVRPFLGRISQSRRHLRRVESAVANEALVVVAL